jgi:hypothetical protein
MSTQLNTYVLVGVKLPYDHFSDGSSSDEDFERLEPYMDSAFKGIEHHDGLCVLFDSVNGKYIAAGRVLAKTGESDGFSGAIDAHMSPALQTEVAALLQQHLQIATPDVRVWVISHYR